MPIRSFIAVEVPDDVQEQLGRIAGKLRECGVKVRWSQPGNIHLTLKFLGDVDDNDIPKVCGVITEAAAGLKPFDVRIAGLGAFPPHGAPRIVWVGITDQTEPLIALAEDLDRRIAETIGIRPEHRKFHPHLTLGRVKSTRGTDRLIEAMQALEPVDLGLFGVDALALFMSKLHSQGSIYTRMAEVGLGS
jgi:2'-5' RNA ligase